MARRADASSGELKGASRMADAGAAGDAVLGRRGPGDLYDIASGQCDGNVTLSQRGPRLPFRYVIVALLFGCNICLYCSRACITVAVIYMFPKDENIEGTLLYAAAQPAQFRAQFSDAACPPAAAAPSTPATR